MEVYWSSLKDASAPKQHILSMTKDGGISNVPLEQAHAGYITIRPSIPGYCCSVTLCAFNYCVHKTCTPHTGMLLSTLYDCNGGGGGGGGGLSIQFACMVEISIYYDAEIKIVVCLEM